MATAVAVAVVAFALALWHLKVLVALLLIALIISAAVRPGIEALHRVPRALGVTIHYLGLLITIGLLVWLIVPRAIDQVEAALERSPPPRRTSARLPARHTGSSTTSSSACSTGSSAFHTARH